MSKLSFINFGAAFDNRYLNEYLLFSKKLKTKPSFARLPNSVLLLIFTYLDERDLKNVVQVCQKWKYNGMNPILWKKLKIAGIKTTEGVNNTLRRIWKMSELENVYIKDVDQASIILRQVHRCLDNLQHLTIRYCSGIQPETMRNIISRCRLLKSLDIKGTEVKCTSFLEQLPQLKNLRALNLTGNKYITPKHMITISLNCRNLEEFYMSLIRYDSKNEDLSDEDCSFMLANMSENLKGFSIDGATLSDLCFQKLIMCDNLRNLAFHRAYNVSGQSLARMWKTVSKLQTLKITHGNLIKDQDVEKLFTDGKDSMKNLTVVDFTGCWRIKNGSIQAISLACPKLRKLILKCCKSVTDIESLKKCENLEQLNIAFCLKLSITSWLPVQKSLKSLFVHDSLILKEIIESLESTNHILKICVCQSQYNKIIEKHYTH